MNISHYQIQIIAQQSLPYKHLKVMQFQNDEQLHEDLLKDYP